MSEKIVCTIPGNIELHLEDHWKLATLIYTYGAERIAALLDKAQLIIKSSVGITDEVVFENNQREGIFSDDVDVLDVSNVNEVEEIMQLQNLSEAFRELKTTPVIILEAE